MKRFAALYAALDATTSTLGKLEALRAYFTEAPPRDAAWAVYFLAGGKPRQAVKTADLRRIAIAASGLDDWLFEECYQTVGDLAETIALVLPDAGGDDDTGLADWVETRLAPLRGESPEVVEARLLEFWSLLDAQGRFLLTKLIGGGFRVGVSKLLVTRALAESAGLDAKRVAQRMMGYTDAKTPPSPARYLALISAADSDVDADRGQPYPFFLAHPLLEEPQTLGDPAQWLAEWKYDGIRAQLVRRASDTWIWSRGEELITERFPELATASAALAGDIVLDGEILVWQDGHPASFALLQQRIGRKTLGKKLLDTLPAVFIAYDILEHDGRDLRELPQHERRAMLEQAIASANHPSLLLSPRVIGESWETLALLREQSRERGVEGLMLKHRDSRYGTGRTRDGGIWWKWKVDPYSVDCVLIYAQAGHGRRASLYTDFTFAVWAEDEGQEPAGRRLVPFAKAYSGLTDDEFREVDAVIRKTTVEKFGPVRSVTPTLVFELGFEGIQRSPRHKSGIAVRFPRMLRWRKDKTIEEADTLETLLKMIEQPGKVAA